MRSAPRAIDAGVREVVAILNRIPGVTTRASCEGGGRTRAGHRHGELAYVLFRYPLPLRLQEFLAAQLGTIGRVEDDGVHSRWPASNYAFVESLAAAGHAYLRAPAVEGLRWVQIPLPKLRAWLARQLSSGLATRIGFCLVCGQLFNAPHAPQHRQLPLLELAADEETRWFEKFAGRPGNALDAALINAHGWPEMVVRTCRGDFGATFLRRWLRYRGARIAQLATQEIRSGVQKARHTGMEIDFLYDDAQVMFAWRQSNIGNVFSGE